MQVLEVLGEGLLQILLEVGLSTFKEERGRTNHHPLLATLGYLFCGGLLGGFSAWLLREPLLPPGPFPGVSMILGPVGAGVVMELWGNYRRARAHETTHLATWYGGAALALGISLMRYLALSWS